MAIFGGFCMSCIIAAYLGASTTVADVGGGLPPNEISARFPTAPGTCPTYGGPAGPQPFPCSRIEIPKNPKNPSNPPPSHPGQPKPNYSGLTCPWGYFCHQWRVCCILPPRPTPIPFPTERVVTTRAIPTQRVVTTPSTPPYRGTTINAPTVYNCDFDSDLCGMVQTQGIEDEMDWTRRTGRTPSANTGPDYDHSTGRGSYIFLEASQQEPGSRAIITLPQFAQHSGLCLHFWYHMFGYHIGSLSIIGRSGVTRSLLWSRTKEGDRGEPRWKEDIVTLAPGIDTVSFMAVRGGANRGQPFGDIAIDDVRVSEGSCGHQGGEQTTVLLTTRSSTTQEVTSSTTQEVTSSTMQEVTSSTTQEVTSSTTQEVTSSTKQEVTSSTTQEVTSSSTSNISMTSAASPISTVRTPTATGSVNPGGVIFTCDFDTDLCGINYVNTSTNHMPWARHRNRTPSGNTGPRGDHTSGQGWYVYQEASFRQPGEMAEFQLPSLNLVPAGACLSFWYHMFGRHIGTLSVDVMVNNNVRATLWSRQKDGDFGVDRWQAASISLPPTVTGVLIKAKRGGALRGQPFGDIAVDDILVTAGTCAGGSGTTVVMATTHRINDIASTTTTTPAQTTADGPPRPSIFSCDFDDSTLPWCGMIQRTDDDIDWWRLSGPTPSRDTGPDRDHTTGRGFYIYLEATLNRPNDTAVIEIPQTLDGAFCLRFWYNMFGQHVRSLFVHLQSDASQTELWSRHKDQGRAWLQASQSVFSVSGSRLLFTAVRGGERIEQPFGDIALDDISLFQGAC